MGFMVAVLGSTIFWVVYFTVSFMITTVLLKKIAPKTFKYTTTNKIQNNDDSFDILSYICIALFTYLFWSLIILWMIIVMKVIWGFFCLCIKTANNIVPEIDIKKKEKQNE